MKQPVFTGIPGTPLRIFLTLWIVYTAHFATDFVREHFLVVSLVDDHTFQLDPYYGMHPDIFRTPDGHAYHGANPGVSMMAAVPYFLLHPLVDAIVERELVGRADQVDAGEYQDPREERREFYRIARTNGWDVRFGLVGLITLALFMAPLTAWSAVVLHRTLINAGLPAAQALGGTLLYALGTPIFFRTGYLNQNLAVGVFALVAFCLLWDPGDRSPRSVRTRHLLAGLCGGLALLCDYSGAVALALLGIYAIWRRTDHVPLKRAIQESLWFGVGALGPILVLWYYQWAAFGDFLHPPQHHMPPVEFSDLGYQGVTGPQWDLVTTLWFDLRFGLFVTAPVLALGLVAPWWTLRGRGFLGRRELLFALGFFAAFTAFFSAVQYTRIQYFTGIRYIVPVIPFLLLATLEVLRQLPRWITYLLAFGSFGLSWIQAMARIQEQESSLLEPIARVVLGGPQLPALKTLERMSTSYVPGVSGGVDSLTVLLAVAALVWMVWAVRTPGRSLAAAEHHR